MPGSTAPVQFGSDYFEFVSDIGISWASAEAAAAATTFMGVNGYLAVITSASENSFLTSNFATSPTWAGAWLGGQVFGSGPPNESFGGMGTWTVGPLVGEVFSIGQTSVDGAFVNWGGIEPNNAPSAVYMLIGPYPDFPLGAWADAANGLASAGDPITGYIVEFDVPNLPPVVAAPATVTVGDGQATAIPGVSLSEVGSTASETFTVMLADTYGILAATGGVQSNSGTTLTITGTLDQVNCDLASLTDTDGTAPSDTITINATDSFGDTANQQQIEVTVNAPPVIGVNTPVTVVQGSATLIPDVTLSENGNTTSETFTVTLDDSDGDLSAIGSGVSGSETTTLTINGTLDEVNDDLATLTDTDDTTPSDTITANATDSFGGTAIPQTIAVTVAPAPAPSVLDFLEFSDLAYSLTDSLHFYGVPLSDPTGFTELDDSVGYGGMTAVTFVDTATKQIVVAYRGSVTAQDWLQTDRLGIAPGNKSYMAPIFASAESVVDQLMDSPLYDDYTFYVTGHSLGGAEAEDVANAFAADEGLDLGGVTFAAPGVSNIVTEPFTYDPDLIDYVIANDPVGTDAGPDRSPGLHVGTDLPLLQPVPYGIVSVVGALSGFSFSFARGLLGYISDGGAVGVSALLQHSLYSYGQSLLAANRIPYNPISKPIFAYAELSELYNGTTNLTTATDANGDIVESGTVSAITRVKTQ